VSDTIAVLVGRWRVADAQATGVEPSEELRALMHRFYAACAQGDADTIANLFSESAAVLAIGTDPGEWWTSHASIVGVWDAQMSEFGGFVFRSQALQGWVQGPVGWVADQVMLEMPDRSERSIRLTAVLHLERGHWRFIQYHLSAGTGNEELLGVELTTTLESLAHSVDVERPDLGAASAPDGTVTVVFTDIESSTAMAERLGDDRWMDLLRWHDRLIRDEADRYQGFVVKSQGDGFMLAFSSATSALDFALATQNALAAPYLGEVVRIRVGINTGEAIREQDDFYGRAVIMAARIAAQATGGEVLVSELVAGLVAGKERFTFGPPRVTDLKGLQGHHTLYPVDPEA
jgi:class 3 adenylate cyclase/ketosteroid isomerase-like protein